MTLSHVDADTSQPLRDSTIGSILTDAAGASPGRGALVVGAVDDHRRWSYEALLGEAQAVGGALAARFDVGERLAVFGPSLPEAVILSYGAAEGLCLAVEGVVGPAAAVVDGADHQGVAPG